MESPTDRPQVIIVQHRPSPFRWRVMLPFVVMLAAMTGLALRASSPDWRGLWQELGDRVASISFKTPKAEKPAKALAKVEKVDPPAPKVEPKPAPAPPEPVKPKPDDAAWDAIKKDAEKAQAERDEAEKLKEQAAEDLAKNPPPPSFRRGRMMPDPAIIAEMRRRQAEMMREMDERMAERMADHQRRFADGFRRQAEQQARMMDELAKRGFAAPPGFGDFGALLPGMDRIVPNPPQPRPGAEPRILEDSGEEIKNGVKHTWRIRIVTNGGL